MSKKQDSQKICFVIAPIGDAGTETRNRSDKILKHVITPAVSECGYEALRADNISEPGIITSQVIQHIVDDPLVIADLTDRNPNVFYELAVRHAIRKPLIQLIQKGESIPFDVAGTRTIFVDHKDLDSAEEAKAEIGRQIKALEINPQNIETPISVSIDLQALRKSENPEQRSVADILSAMTELRHSVMVLEKRFSSPEGILPKEFVWYLTDRLEKAGLERGFRDRDILLQLREEIAMCRNKLSNDKFSQSDMAQTAARLKSLEVTIQKLIRTD